MKELKNLIFDYPDIIYRNENPLFYVLKHELHKTIRESFYLLTELEKFIITEIVLKKKSVTNTALFLDMSEKEVSNRLEIALELLFRLFENKYGLLVC